MLLCWALGIFIVSVIQQTDAADSPSPSDYASKYAWIDFETLTSSPRFLTGYIKCLLRKGPCSPEGRILRRLLPEVIATDCARCSPEQIVLTRRLVKYIHDNRPEEYRLLQNLYDPKAIHQEHFIAFIEGRSQGTAAPIASFSPTNPPELIETPSTRSPSPPLTRPTTTEAPITRPPSRPPPPTPLTRPTRPPFTKPPPPPLTRPATLPTPRPSPPPPPTLPTPRTPPPTQSPPIVNPPQINLQPDYNVPQDSTLTGSVFVRATSNAQANANRLEPSANPPISSTILPPFFVKFESPLLNIFSELKLGVRQAAANLQVKLG